MFDHTYIHKYIYCNRAIDPRYTTKPYSLDHKKSHNIVICKEKDIYIFVVFYIQVTWLFYWKHVAFRRKPLFVNGVSEFVKVSGM